MFRIHKFFLRHKAAAFLAVLSFVGIVAFLASGITLEEDITGLIPAGDRQNVMRKVLDQSEFSDKIIVTISSTAEEPDPEEITLFAQQFLDSLENDLPEYYNDIQGKVPDEGIRELYNFVYNNLPLFLNEADYGEINNRLPRDSIRQRLQANYKNLISPTGLVLKDFIFKDPLSITNLGLRKLEELQVDEDFELYNNFLVTRDRRHVLLFISPAFPSSETDRNSYFIGQLEEIQQGLEQEFPNVQADYFGGVLYSIANARQIKNDIRLTLSIAASILLIILIFYYRRIYVPLVLFLPVLIGGLTAIAVLFLLKGTVSAISLGVGAILLGISIDYSLHILTHFKNNQNVEKLYRDVTGPVLMSSSTTAIAFLCLLFVRSEALNDLGIFAAVSVLVSSIFALILIPVLYHAPVTAGNRKTLIDRVAGFELHKNKPVVAVISLLFIAALFFFTGVKFNYDLSALNYEPEEIREKEKNVQNIAGRAAKSIYLVSYGLSVDEALENNNHLYMDLRRMEQEGRINSFSSIGGVVLSTSTQLNRIGQWKDFWTEPKKEQTQSILIQESAIFGFRPQSFDGFYQLMEKDFATLYLEDYRNTSTLYLNDFISEGENFATVTSSINVRPENLEEVKNEFKNRENTVVIDRKQVNESFLGNLKDDFNRLIGYSLIAVFLVLLIFYRSLELTFLTLFPIGITWVVALGIMAVAGIEFNILNIIISTFIFGLGLDYSIFITNAFLKEYESSIRVLKTYRTSILLSVLTTLLGIGSLFFAKHPALRSVSVVSIIGILSAVTVAFVLQSYILNRLFLRRKEQGIAPFSINSLLDTASLKGKTNLLYFKKEVYDNYRYKVVFPEVKKEIAEEKERYLKVAEFLNENDRILQFNSGYGVLAIYLTYKVKGLEITAIEPNEEQLLVARNTYRNSDPKLEFLEEIPEVTGGYDVLIVSGEGNASEIKKMITAGVKKIIILDPAFSYRFIIDLNFEILYRQNEVVMLQKVE